MTEEQITQQAINELDARQAAMRVYDAVMMWAEAAATAFPENFARLREPALHMTLVYDEADGRTDLGARDSKGTNFTLHAVAMDLKRETFGRPLDKILIAAMNAVPRDPKPPNIALSANRFMVQCDNNNSNAVRARVRILDFAREAMNASEAVQAAAGRLTTLQVDSH